MKPFLLLSVLALSGCNRPSVDTALLKDADAGSLEAQLTVGNTLLDQKDNDLGKKYMLMAAEQGSVDALNNLGYMERGNTGLPTNMGEALKWHRIAEIVSGRPSANVTFDKKDMDSATIQRAETAARKWLEDRPNVRGQ